MTKQIEQMVHEGEIVTKDHKFDGETEYKKHFNQTGPGEELTNSDRMKLVIDDATSQVKDLLIHYADTIEDTYTAAGDLKIGLAIDLSGNEPVIVKVGINFITSGLRRVRNTRYGFTT